MSDTRARLKALVTRQLACDEAKVTDDALFGDDLRADSLDLIELTVEIEDAFGIEISDREAERARTFGDALQLVRTKLGETADA